jgi:predicted TIM-barrel fold metal-dependent hydrolase
MGTTSGAVAERVRAISADSHVMEPAGTYRDHIEPMWRERAPVLVDDPGMGATMVIDPGSPHESRIPYPIIAGAGVPWDRLSLRAGTRFEDLHRGGWDPVARLGDQDRDGIAAEVIYPSTGMLLCNHPDVDYKHACFAAYNRWVAGFCATAPDRLIGLGQTAMRTQGDTLADLEAIRSLGLRGVMLPGFPGEADFDDPCWDEVWDALVALALPPSFHILTAGQSVGGAGFRGPKLNSFLGIIRGNQDIIGVLTYGGVFERHPQLRVVCVEADAGWLPHYLYRMDHAYERHRNWLTVERLSKAPSAYVLDQVYLTFQDDHVAFQTAHLMNADRLLWANDFPHSDSTWPDSQAVLAEQTAHLDPAVVTRIVRDNVAELYGLASPVASGDANRARAAS